MNPGTALFCELMSVHFVEIVRGAAVVHRQRLPESGGSGAAAADAQALLP